MILLGGTFGPEYRASVAAGDRPTPDELRMAELWQAEIRDLGQIAKPRGRLRGPIVELGKRLAGWSAVLAAQSFRKARRTQVVYATGEDIGIPLGFLYWLTRTRRGRSRIIMRLERASYGRSALRRRVYGYWFRLGIRGVSDVLCRTEALATEVRKIAPERVRVQWVPEATDVAFFDPRSRIAQSVNDEPPYILSAGLEERDYETLLQIADQLDVNVVIAAGSPWAKSVFNPPGGLPAHVRVSSFKPLEMRELYRGALAVVVPVNPTIRACGMNVVLEAWAMNRPVIATATPGLESYLQSGVDALTVPADDPEALRNAIDLVLNDHTLADRLAAAGHAKVTARMSQERYLELIRAVIDA